MEALGALDARRLSSVLAQVADIAAALLFLVAGDAGTSESIFCESSLARIALLGAVPAVDAVFILT